MWTKYLGRLKEQDDLIEIVLKWILVPEHDMTLSLEESLARMEELISQHVTNPENSRLKKLIPGMGLMRARLQLTAALKEYNDETYILNRRYIPPNFRDIRTIMNYSVVRATAKSLRLVTFDADETVYKTGFNLSKEDWVVGAILKMLKSGVCVAIVTAAGYPGEPAKYETRLGAILEAMRDEGLPHEICKNFFIVGGQCNYMCHVTESFRLDFVPREEWHTEIMLSWRTEDIAATLDIAEGVLRESIDRLRIPATVVRKERTVGCFKIDPNKKIPFESFEDVTLALHDALKTPAVPCCAFNGGQDVFVDVGDKSYGVVALQNYLKIDHHFSVHFGDGFYMTGNDLRVRDAAHTLWVANPEETQKLLSKILEEISS